MLKDFAPGKPITLVTDDDFIVLASVISPAEWAESLAQLRQTFVAVALLLVFLTTFMTAFFQMRHRAQMERDRFFNLTRDMLCIAGFDGYFKRVNPAWEATLGYTPEEMVNRPYLDFVHPDDREKTIQEANRLALGNEVTAFENRYRCKDGTYRWLQWSARSLPEERLIYASARNVTARKESAERIQKLNEELKTRAHLLERPTRKSSRFPIPSRTICARPCAISTALLNSCKNRPPSTTRRPRSGICMSSPRRPGKWGC